MNIWPLQACIRARRKQRGSIPAHRPGRVPAPPVLQQSHPRTRPGESNLFAPPTQFFSLTSNKPALFFTQAPFHVSELGWGEFEIVIRIHLHEGPEQVPLRGRARRQLLSALVHVSSLHAPSLTSSSHNGRGPSSRRTLVHLHAAGNRAAAPAAAVPQGGRAQQAARRQRAPRRARLQPVRAHARARVLRRIMRSLRACL